LGKVDVKESVGLGEYVDAIHEATKVTADSREALKISKKIKSRLHIVACSGSHKTLKIAFTSTETICTYPFLVWRRETQPCHLFCFG
jgi:hypothetical protein